MNTSGVEANPSKPNAPVETAVAAAQPSVTTPIPTTGPSAPAAATQPASRQKVKSPEVGPDGKVTVRLYAPKASEVSCESLVGRFPMTRGTDGVWAATFGPLEPDIYEYAFNVDGVRFNDPLNPAAKTPVMSFLPITGDTPAPWEVRNVPHGKVQFHWYHSTALGIDRRVHVYTPPGYDAAAAAQYPVLYLLHGSGDDDSGWVNIGRADLIFDNLLAESKMKPMVVVMPEGHTPANPTVPPFAPLQAPPTNNSANTRAATVNPDSLTTQPVTVKGTSSDRSTPFVDDLMKDVIPLVEKSYRVKTDAMNRAVAGLSMGGGQSLQISLAYPDQFAYVALMSAGFRGSENLDRVFPEVAAGKFKAGSPFKMYWIGCGKKDRLLSFNRKLDQWLGTYGITHEFHEGEGSHDWRVWRRNLIEIAPMLFSSR